MEHEYVVPLCDERLPHVTLEADIELIAFGDEQAGRYTYVAAPGQCLIISFLLNRLSN